MVRQVGERQGGGKLGRGLGIKFHFWTDCSCPHLRIYLLRCVLKHIHTFMDSLITPSQVYDPSTKVKKKPKKIKPEDRPTLLLGVHFQVRQRRGEEAAT